MKPADQLKILEVGEFSLFKRSLPDRTTLIFTGENPTRVADIDCHVFSPALLPWLSRALSRGEWDIVFCYAPVRPLWDRKHGFAAASKALLRRLARPRTLGTAMLRLPPSTPMVMLDLNDETLVPAHNLPLLDRALLCFKRELPLDGAKVFLDATRYLRSHRAVMASPLVARNLDKLRPISPAIAQETARLALATNPVKQVDVFFAGSINSTLRARGLPVLRALQEEGYVVDVGESRLPMAEYLARCARAWLAWSPEGYGWECHRHYESSLCLSVPVLSQPGISRYQPLRDGEHAVFYAPDGDGLRETIITALADKQRLSKMAEAARAHVLHYHTHRRIVDHMLAESLAAFGEKGRAMRQLGPGPTTG
jgi:hypothetical protein